MARLQLTDEMQASSAVTFCMGIYNFDRERVQKLELGLSVTSTAVPPMVILMCLYAIMIRL